MALPTKVTRSQTSDPFELMRRDLDSLLGRFWGDRLVGQGESWIAPYGVDIREDADHIYVEADLPGFRREDVDVTLDNGVLTISAEKREEPQQQGPDKGNYLLHERRYQQFVRSFTLPPGVDEKNVNAKLENGCLTVTLNKTEQSKPRRIQIGGGESGGRQQPATARR